MDPALGVDLGRVHSVAEARMQRGFSFISFFLLAFVLVTQHNCSSGQFSGKTPSTGGKPNPADQTATGKAPSPTPNNGNPTIDGTEPYPVSSTSPTQPTTGSGINWGEIINELAQKAGPIFGGDDSTIDFDAGNGRVFHIGDNEMENSTCLGNLTVEPLSGTGFYFEFDVAETVTQVDIQIVDICGVDYSDSNYMSLTKDGGVFKDGFISKGGLFAKSDVDLGKITLDVGHYVLMVESRPNQRSITPQTPEGDRDDFIVGKVTIHSDHPLVKGRVYAQ